MDDHRSQRGWMGIGCLTVLLLGDPALAPAFNSGSTGALGAFNPTTNTVVPLPPDGILNYTTVNIPAGVTVTVARNIANTPVTWLATGDITLAGTLDVSGSLGPQTSVFETPGGPGGFPGGVGGSPPTGGAGPGGGAPSGSGPSNATYGAPASFVTALPLFGGSGGGGGLASSLGATGGGGGGGALVLASSTQIRVTGTILALGGDGGQSPAGTGFTAGGGSGGAIRLVAPADHGHRPVVRHGRRGGPAPSSPPVPASSGWRPRPSASPARASRPPRSPPPRGWPRRQARPRSSPCRR